MAAGDQKRQAQRITLSGGVQGVGFRPFVYRLAHGHSLTGWVRNVAGRVDIFIQGAPHSLTAFNRELLATPPPLAQPRLESIMEAEWEPHQDEFIILPSAQGPATRAAIPPDYFACDDCLAEMHDPQARRYRYPFINCTQCGPRYTLIERLPYDRPHTAMAGFPLCADCRTEYENPLDRRFHAQPLACPACGPKLYWHGPSATNATNATSHPEAVSDAALAACIRALHGGLVVAVKGVGGYHLLCDAQNDAAIHHLRRHKPRPHKPLAVMVPMAGEDGLEQARTLASLNNMHARQLCHPMRPIVLAPKRPDAPLSRAIAPALGEVGLMLPYAPLHHLLLETFGSALVATSGNISGEPVLTHSQEVIQRLGHVAQGFLHHDRPILRPADDPLFRVIENHPQPLRLGRGCTPLELALPHAVKTPLLGVGGQMKNSIALAWDNRVVISPHIGELSTPRGMLVFKQVMADLSRLHAIEPQRIACDAHPGYDATRWSQSSHLPVIPIFHHHAHASALAGEHGWGEEPLLVFTWDGVGLGADGTLWGGEALLGMPGSWQRVASFRPFRPLGGDQAARAPWRSALGLAWEAGIEWPGAPFTTPSQHALARHAWERQLNTPATSAVGRLFDAAAALLGVLSTASFEGQGPMYLETLAEQAGQGEEGIPLPLKPDPSGLLITDWQPLLHALWPTPARTTIESARLVHATLARALVDQAVAIRKRYGVTTAGLTGGVFQNRILTEEAAHLLQQHGFQLLIHRKIPCNDAALAFGQIIEAEAQSRREPHDR
ncbi:MAG: carbamoyltransferase HypF [Magnetococcales bacterium]|nr:carbamoyltransferase HypF [Magnetococcales bacterium]